MKQIAILTTDTVVSNYGDDYATIAKSITEWSEVSEEDYKLLRSWCGRNNSYILVNREDVKPEFIPKLVSQFLVLANEERRKEEERKQKAEEVKIQREIKKKAKTETQEKKLLEELQKKYAS